MSGTNKYAVEGHGDFVEYVTDDKERITVNDKGEPLPQDATLLNNGLYTIESDEQGTVYDAQHQKLFSYDVDDFTVKDAQGDYIFTYKYDKEIEYGILNLKGEVLVEGLKGFPYIYGDLIHSDNKIYNLDGETVIDGTYTSVYMDECFQNVWLLKNDSEFTMIDKQGTILYQGKEDDEYSVDSSYFSISKSVDDERMKYCFKDKEFSIEGFAVAPWLVEVLSEDNTYEIVYSVSGDSILKGYTDYYYATMPGFGFYVYAKNSDNGYDVYSVK